MQIPRGRSLWTAKLAHDSADSSQETILAELRRVILDGGAPPGISIPIDDVADSFGVSRIPVREALNSLVSEGLVSQIPRSNYRVAQLTRGELSEFYIVRGALELATLGTAVDKATADDDGRAMAAHAALQKAIRAGDVQGHHRESRRFHLTLLAPSRMARMLYMLESAWNLTEPVQPIAYAGAPEGAQFNTDHQLMLDAFIARDGAGLIEITRAHHAHLSELIATLPRNSGLFLDD